MANEPSSKREQQDPGYARVRDFLLYSLSLPERTLRSASGMVGGALRESASLLVPQAFQSSTTYSVMGKVLGCQDSGGPVFWGLLTILHRSIRWEYTRLHPGPQ